MCGFVGICQKDGSPVSTDLLTRMNNLLKHRGPDDEGYQIRGNIGLGQRRLSIIDLDTGHQPLANEDETLWIVFNGEIYNYIELREELIKRGHRFRTQSDTEVIVHLFEERGPDCVSELRGMFSFCIWNQKDGSLFLARDRVGIKPLFYVSDSKRFVFSSEMKALRILPSFSPQVDPPALFEYLTYRYVAAPRTLYKRVRKLPAGHCLLYRDGHLREWCYWDVFQDDATEDLPSRDFRECVEQLKNLLEESVRLRLRSDVPLGAFLSGGIDSSTVTGFMSRLVPGPIQTFSVGFQDPRFDERPYAREVANRFGTVHREIEVQPEDVFRDLPRLIWHRDAPVSEASDIALFALSRLASQSVKVVLSGEGGDELFAGYLKYLVDPFSRYYQWIPERVEHALIFRPIQHFPWMPRRLKTLVRSLRMKDERERFASYFASLDLSDRAQVLSTAFLHSFDEKEGEDTPPSGSDGLSRRTPMERMFYGDLTVWLPDNLLERGDRITMAASIEGRVPLLDHKLVEFAAKIPFAWKRRFFDTKYILKQTLQELLPTSIRGRKKVGFTVPIREWFRGELKDWLCDTLLSHRARNRGIFNVPEVERILHRHLDGREDLSKHLWMLLNLELWFDQLSGQNPEPS